MLYAKGLYVLPSGADGVRAIPYLNISRQQILDAISIIASVAEEHAGDAKGSAHEVGGSKGAGY